MCNYLIEHCDIDGTAKSVLRALRAVCYTPQHPGDHDFQGYYSIDLVALAAETIARHPVAERPAARRRFEERLRLTLKQIQ
jgi:hypothetical protein